MTNESTFQILTAVLVVLANVSLWKTRGASRLKTDWPTMKKNGKDTLVLLLVSLGWAFTLVAFWTSLSFLEKFALPIHPLVRWIGFPIGLGAIHFLSKADKALGKNLSLSPEIKQNHSLVTHGPYKYVRHPIYLHSWPKPDTIWSNQDARLTRRCSGPQKVAADLERYTP